MRASTRLSCSPSSPRRFHSGHQERFSPRQPKGGYGSDFGRGRPSAVRENLRAAVFITFAMYVIRLERCLKEGELVVMWLKSAGAVVRWGPREDAMRFATKGEARRVARTLRLRDGWSIEEA